MKSKELIRQLQEIDPTGEMEVTCGKADIYFLSTEPGYYDGCAHILKRDPELEGKSYSVIGVEICSGGTFIILNSMNAWDAIMNDPDVPVTYDSDYARKHYESRVKAERRRAKGIYKEVKKTGEPS